nr:CapA family protein [Alkalilimnicola ehrlichii]
MISLFVCGDVMTGRGIDQVLAHPVSPELYESFVLDARDYVTLAERRNGNIPRPLSGHRLWGAALTEFDRRLPQARIVNLETSITTHPRPWPDKGINYRMHRPIWKRLPSPASTLAVWPIIMCWIGSMRGCGRP